MESTLYRTAGRHFSGLTAALLLLCVLTISPFAYLCGASAQAQTAGSEADVPRLPPGAEVFRPLAVGVKKFTLPNGLRVLFYRRGESPIFAGQVWVKVGGVNEVPGSKGSAHLLEHMAFKGTKTVGTKDFQKERELLDRYERVMNRVENNDVQAKAELEELQQSLQELWVEDEFSNIYRIRGGVGLNAATSKDYTFYMVSLPNTEFELWAWMESERLLNPVFRGFYGEREVVREERRSRTDDNPGGRLYEAMLAAAYWVHPNRLPIIGWAADLARLRTEHVEKLHQTYYRPDNIVLALVGDLNPAEAMPVIERYFGRLPRRDERLPGVYSEEPPQTGERRVEVRFEAEPRLALAFHKPVFPHRDDMVFSVFHAILTMGYSAVLKRELVQEKQLAVAAGSSEAPGELFPSLFYVSALPRRGVTPERLLGEIEAILNRFKTAEISDAELAAAKKRVRVEMLKDLTSNYGLAEAIAHAETIYGDWKVLIQMYEQLLSVTEEDIRRVAAQYLRPENKTVVIMRSARGQ